MKIRAPANTPSWATTSPEQPGQVALQIGIAQLGKPYVYGATGPDSFDCSGFTQYCYNNGPHIAIGRTVGDQWSSPNLTTIYDAPADQAAVQAGGVSSMPAVKDLQTGDLLMYFVAGTGGTGQNAHVVMYAGNGQVIEAPHTGDVVKYSNVVLGDLDSKEPFRGIRRSQGGGALSSGQSTQGSGNGNQPTGDLQPTDQAAYQKMLTQMKALKDPDNNLPFSALFQGQIINGMGSGFAAGQRSSGSLRVPLPQGLKYPGASLTRGGMGEMIIQRFKCYFMINPQTISVTAGVNTSQLSPFEQGPDQWLSGGYFVTNQTVSFTIYFNRMYEVWKGNVIGPSGDSTTGPSAEGCRWDMRALERLMGIFDAGMGGQSKTGEGNNGWGSTPASMIPIQVAFGGPNALMFQGVITGFDYTFTIFDSQMIPVECYADIQLMRVYNPTASGADLVSSLISRTSAFGPQNLPGNQAGPVPAGKMFTA